MYIELRPEDIVYTKYKTYPSQTSIFVTTQGDPSSTIFDSGFYRIESDADFAPGIERNLYGADSGWITGSYNISGTIQVVVNSLLSDGEKYSINRLRSIYGENNFRKPQNYTSSSVYSASVPSGQYMTLVNIPSVLYGEEIKPGSFKMDTVGDGSSILTDDGYGGILSQSVLIGSIFYQHGIVMLGHHSETMPLTSVVLDFSGTHTIPMMMYVCTAPRGMLNHSQNKSFTVYNTSSNQNEITTKTNKTFVTTVCLYDEDYELLAVAKTAKPILNEEDGSIQFRLKVNC